jgi:hypothetical protein
LGVATASCGKERGKEEGERKEIRGGRVEREKRE